MDHPGQEYKSAQAHHQTLGRRKVRSLLKVHDGEIEFVVSLVDASAAPDDLLEFRHRIDGLVQHDQLAGLRIYARAHQL